MRKYEIMFMVKATMESSLIEKTADSFKKLLTENKAKVLESRALGERKLAYPIKKELNGYYFLMQVEAGSEAIAEFDRKALIDENMLRHLIIKLDEGVK